MNNALVRSSPNPLKVAVRERGHVDDEHAPGGQITNGPSPRGLRQHWLGWRRCSSSPSNRRRSTPSTASMRRFQRPRALSASTCACDLRNRRRRRPHRPLRCPLSHRLRLRFRSSALAHHHCLPQQPSLSCFRLRHRSPRNRRPWALGAQAEPRRAEPRRPHLDEPDFLRRWPVSAG